MKQMGMLVISLRGVNCGFWSRLGCSEQSANILCRQGLVQGFAKKHRITQGCFFPDDYVFISLKLIAYRICVFLSGLFQGSKFFLSHAQICLLQVRALMKKQTEITWLLTSVVPTISHFYFVLVVNVFPVTCHNSTIPSFPLDAVFDPTGSEISSFQTAKTG